MSLKAILVGTGRISAVHAIGYTDIGEGSLGAELIGVCDLKEKRARKFADEWGIKKIYTDFKDVLRDEEVDIVEILIPHSLHEKMVVAACEARKHVSVQKPPALTLSSMD